MVDDMQQLPTSNFEEDNVQRTPLPFDLENDTEGQTPELDQILGPDAPEDAVIAYNRSMFPDDDSFSMLDGTVEVAIPIPLGVFMEELPSGKVFVDEVEPGGNADKTGALQEGDLIVAMSLPYSSALVPLPDEGALEEVESFVKSRSGEAITFAVRRGGDVESFREEIRNNSIGISPEKIQIVRDLANTEWYPCIPFDEDEPSVNSIQRIDDLTAMGIDMSVDVGYSPTPEEIAKAEVDDVDDFIGRPDEDDDDSGDPYEDDEELRESAEYWRKSYEKGK